MEIIIEKETLKIEYLMSKKDLIVSTLSSACNSLKLDTVSKIVITGHDTNSYRQSILKHAGHLDDHVSITDNSSYSSHGTVIRGVAVSGEFEQVIFLRDDIFIPWLYSIDSEVKKSLNEEGMDLVEKVAPFIYHELGHALDYQLLYRHFGYSEEKKQFDLKYERDEYLEAEALILWSEYFAERIANIFLDTSESMEFDNLANACLYSKSAKLIGSELVDHAYRIGYYYALVVAHYHSKESTQSLNEKVGNHALLSKYSTVLYEFGETLSDLFDSIGDWDFDKVRCRLGCGYLSLIEADYVVHSNQ